MGYWKGLAKVVSYPALHPQRILKATMNTAKTGAFYGTVGYLGWEKLTTDKSLARIAGEAGGGKSVVDGVVSIGSGLDDLREDVGDTLGKVNNTLTDVDGGLNGITKFFRGLSNGGNMLGDFISNLTSGKVSGLGITGLVGAALLVFGRFGWFGKIAGALLGMFVIGNNFNLKNTTGGPVAGKNVEEESRARASAYSPKEDQQRVFVKVWDTTGKDLPAVELPREQYDSFIRTGYTNAQIYQEVVQMRQEEEKRGTGIAR